MIVITGYADLEGAVAVIRHGIADFIPKPINPEMLAPACADGPTARDGRTRAAGRTPGDDRTDDGVGCSRESQRVAANHQFLGVARTDPRGRPRGSQGRRQHPAGRRGSALHSGRTSLLRRTHPDRAAHLRSGRFGGVPGRISRRSDWTATSAWSSTRGPPTFAATSTASDWSRFFAICSRTRFPRAGLRARSKCHCNNHQDNGIDSVRIVIGDDGPGLNEEQKAKIFEPFFTTKAEGTGLGMAIAKRIIESHGGQISVIELADRPGTTFAISLPATPGRSRHESIIRHADRQDEASLGRIIEDSLNEIFIFDARTWHFLQVNRVPGEPGLLHEGVAAIDAVGNSARDHGRRVRTTCRAAGLEKSSPNAIPNSTPAKRRVSLLRGSPSAAIDVSPSPGLRGDRPRHHRAAAGRRIAARSSSGRSKRPAAVS